MNRILEKFGTVHPKRGELALCRLGQHSFIAKTGETLIAFDPYLTDRPNRLIPSPIAPEDFAGMSLILCSHDHSDHLDRPSLAAMAKASPDAVFLVPEAIRSSVTEIPPERLRGMNDPQTLEFGGIRITAFASAHEFLDRTPEGLYPYLGYGVECGGVRIYHSGDCCRYEGLLPKLLKFRPDLVLLPINGRDAWRYTHDCIGCMTWQEAADLAGETGAEIAVPAHYDMFSGNTADPHPFAEYLKVKYPRTEPAVLEPGELRLFRTAKA